MANVVLYIATSLDSYIARRDGSVDWLTKFETDETDYGYSDFYSGVGAVLIGRKTYEQALGFGEWPYFGKTTYVFTGGAFTSERDDIVFTSGAPERVVREIAAQGVKKIWLVGGAELIASFLRHGLIDEFIISVIPVLLGDGIPLFLPPYGEVGLKLEGARRYLADVVQLQLTRA